MTLIISAVIIFISVFLGGLFALKFKDKLHLILGFSAGSVIGVAFFELLPESFSLASGIYKPETIALFLAIGFIIYLLADRLLAPHSHHDDCCENKNNKGALGAGSLSLHGLADGLITGFAFQISPVVGTILTIVIFIHSFSDGINVVNMILRSGGSIKRARTWLLTDALAPVLGIFLSIFISIPENIFSLLIAIFCGFFIYIGASDLLPESHHTHPKLWTTISTILGMALIFAVTILAGI
jgi:ZIP family zinc transporter